MVDNFSKYRQLREKHQNFIYRDYQFHIKNGVLHILFDFRIDNILRFNPSYTINVEQLPIIRNKEPFPAIIDNVVFHIGMIELISYWKCCCPPSLKILCGDIDEGSKNWWKKLYFNGLGEFFYTNGIDPDYESFMSIDTEGPEIEPHASFGQSNGMIIPVGGGKDSTVTLELLKDRHKSIPFFLNPNPAMERTAALAGFKPEEFLIFRRRLDPKLLELNDQGFLNGHTPFSALLAFVSLLAGVLTDIPAVALSNESSANEPTIPGTGINHQYSKSFEFETLFREYIHHHISDSFNYFSFLRPLNELQIASIFARFKHHHHSFRSCNVGSRQDRWCGNCPKCLFAYIILSPYISQDQLIRIFDKDLFRDEKLIHLLEQLSGLAPEKPFECIGTIDEVNSALRFIIENRKEPELPPLLRHYQAKTDLDLLSHPDITELTGTILEKEHYLSEKQLSILKEALHNG